MDLLWILLALLLPFMLHYFRAVAAPKMPVGPVIALSHGGGPMPLLNDPGHKSIIYSLRNRIPEILRLASPTHRPSAIILVTAHWTTPSPVSVLASEDPAQHLRMGRALAALREDNVAIVGSGFASFHNLGIMRSLRGFAGNSLDKNWLAFKAKTDEWNAALTEAVAPANATERADRVARWRELPHADMMHPPRGGEHFMPLIVCAGAAREEDGAAKTYKDEYMGVDIFTYYWGAPAVST
ncbi:aromatic ring-opening dioxygenase LigB subunit, putative [Cordyceps militaris CM01]|uniref:Aromatic ring-opening dioxygenase LigB subunit, putative n=1 Tax=Cordyceps militaris (strain CM01) TaxID=983644 RepID=G3JAK5_CORMM|nr:aromatic ring-opening dioxygenase LigB subunit, putative [Cordyceps militaris CM01]EGX94321.1 aromatic ring-opening dioxygenase LigB subunit, putative [Cordyceps militaris CM01]